MHNTTTKTKNRKEANSPRNICIYNFLLLSLLLGPCLASGVFGCVYGSGNLLNFFFSFSRWRYAYYYTYRKISVGGIVLWFAAFAEREKVKCETFRAFISIKKKQEL